MKNLSLIICLTISALFGSVGGVVASDLPDCLSSGYFDNCFGTYTFEDGEKYVGEWKDDKYNGQGTYTYAGGDNYVGEWKDGNKNGQGTYTFAHGEKYVGEFKDDVSNGQGIRTYADGDKYEGEEKDGKKHGQGTYTFASGTVKEGIWKDDEFEYAQNNLFSNSDERSSSTLPSCPSDTSVRWHDCFGAYTFGSDSEWAGDKYVGEWKDDKYNGQGAYTYADGDKYFGEYRNGDRNGLGTFTYSDGEKYVGEWKDDKYNGQGTYTFADGTKEVGEFKDDKLNGYAVRYSSDGSILKEGIWKDDEFQYAQANPSSNSDETSSSTLPSCPTDPSVHWHDCFGAYTFASDSDWAGDKYVGEWKDNKLNGKGTYTYANGDKYVGGYRDNQRHGQGTLILVDGDKYVGEFREDKRTGRGTFTWGPNSEWAGDEYLGEFKNGQRTGQGTYIFADGEKYLGEFRDGKFHGKGRYLFGPASEWAGDKYVGEFQHDNKQGKGTYTSADGDKYVGEWKDNKKHGRGIYTIIDGGSYGDRQEYVGEFRDDNFNGEGTYTEYLNGKIVSKTEGTWKDDEFQYVQANPSSNSDETSSSTLPSCPTDSGVRWHDCFGAYTSENGDKYVGEFKDDASNGPGTYTFADGSVKEGIWKDWEFQYAQGNPSPAPEVETTNQDDEVISASSGSGFAVSYDGYVITNHHVIDGCEKVVIHTKEDDFTVKVITYDPQNDLALLKGDFRPSTVFPLSSNRPELLQDIYVAGFPFGDMLSTTVKVTKGIISSLTGLGNNFSNFQIDAALQSGNSGGPILDDLGNVVGVAVAKLDAKYMFEELGIIPEDTNFGIKSNVVRSILESNDVESPSANQSEISKSKLGKMISTGTYYISCWMTTAQIEEMKTKKVLFGNPD
jgi:hypothetical protein